MRAGHCFRHGHCTDGKMCSGQGECVQPHISVLNEYEHDIEFQIFTGNSECTNCEQMTGTSRFENVVDFAQSNGMCSMKNWYTYVNTTSHPDVRTEGHFKLVPKRLLWHKPGMDDIRSIEQMQILVPHADKCDRSYQHTQYKYLVPTEDNEVFRGVNTMTSDEVKFCDLQVTSDEHAIGFLNPYKDKDNQDTLLNVPSLIAHCTEFQVCVAAVFRVDDTKVRRRVAALNDVTNFETSSRLYHNNDADFCFGAGYRICLLYTSDAADE